MSAPSSQSDIIVGIDLGTTNSSIGYLRDGKPVLVAIDGSPLMPSVVGFAPDGQMLVGQAARNQRHLYPESTLRSVKRRMGEDVRLPLGDDRSVSPVEASALILKRLKSAVEAELGAPVRRAVITVPAYFSDAQRTATREAGELAGLEVARILNEPTAAAVAYVGAQDVDGTYLVYDLGGGTFDVSIVRMRDDLTEVLASHGDTQLGGDDFDERVVRWLRERFTATGGGAKGGDGLGADLRASARLERAAEGAKIELSSSAFVRIVEEHLLSVEGRPAHLDAELLRSEYEVLIEELLERTLDSVTTALQAASLRVEDIDDVLLVGGSTRTPRVAELLRQRVGRMPRMDIDPDRAVALGATLHAARIAGHATSHILVDVTPFSFGTSHLGHVDGHYSPHAYSVILPRNTPLPCRRSSLFYTVYEGQEAVTVHIFQGESPDARDNILIGEFQVEGLDTTAPDHSPIVFDLSLDLDGILCVRVTEKHTGLEKTVTIDDAFRVLDEEAIAAARARLAEWMGDEDGAYDDEDDDDEDGDEGDREASGALARARAALEPPADLEPAERTIWSSAVALVEKADRLLPKLADVDAAEVQELASAVEAALRDGDFSAAQSETSALADVLFYLE